MLWAKRRLPPFAGSSQARQGGQPARAWGPRHYQSRGSRQSGLTPERLGCFGISRGARGRCCQESIGQGPRCRQRTTRVRTHRRVQGVHGAFHQAHRQVEVGVGGRERIVGAESRQVGEVGSSTSSSGQRFCGWRWSPGVVLATDGDPVASRARFIVPGVVVDLTRGHADIHCGKTKIWNRSGEKPSGVDQLTMAARVQDPGAIVWRRDDEIPASKQGMKVLGALLGRDEHTTRFLEKKSEQHDILFQRVPMVPDVQASWLLLSICAATRANFYMRNVAPEVARPFAISHDFKVHRVCARSLVWTQKMSAGVLSNNLRSHSTSEDWGCQVQ